jgi:hypothetical protein
MTYGSSGGAQPIADRRSARWQPIQAPPEADFCFERRFAETATSARDKALSLVSDFICEAPRIPGLSTRQW